MIELEPRNADGVKRLLDGNRRFAAEKRHGSGRCAERRAAVACRQEPFAVVIGCSDSRVPPEIVFDQGIGDLFVIRSAGGILDTVGFGSVEYAVAHLGVRLIAVLGHTRCGAVGAALEGGRTQGHLITVVESVGRAVQRARECEGDLHDLASRCNVELVVEELKASEPVLRPLVEAAVLEVVGFHYDLDAGTVEIIC